MNGWQRRENKTRNEKENKRRTFEYTAEATRLNRLARLNWNSELVQRIARRRKVNTELKFEHSLCYAMPCHTYIRMNVLILPTATHQTMHIRSMLGWMALSITSSRMYSCTYACAGCVRNILISDYATWQLYAMQILHDALYMTKRRVHLISRYFKWILSYGKSQLKKHFRCRLRM